MAFQVYFLIFGMVSGEGLTIMASVVILLTFCKDMTLVKPEVTFGISNNVVDLHGHGRGMTLVRVEDAFVRSGKSVASEIVSMTYSPSLRPLEK